MVTFRFLVAISLFFIFNSLISQVNCYLIDKQILHKNQRLINIVIENNSDSIIAIPILIGDDIKIINDSTISYIACNNSNNSKFHTLGPCNFISSSRLPSSFKIQPKKNLYFKIIDNKKQRFNLRPSFKFSYHYSFLEIPLIKDSGELDMTKLKSVYLEFKW